MGKNKTHEDQIKISIFSIQKLIDAQFPKWSSLPLKQIHSSGTDNFIYRLGTKLAIRMPRIVSAAKDIEKEYEWLPKLSLTLPLTVPVPLAKGLPSTDFPWPWMVYRWIEGKDATIEHVTDRVQAAVDLGQFVSTLQKIDVTSAPISKAIPKLLSRDHETHLALHALKGSIDVKRAEGIWGKSLNAAQWSQPLVWIHGDLHPGNLLIKQGRLRAVIDFSTAGIGDPAVDIMVAWTFLSAETRAIFRKIIQVDEATWLRGKGWALTFGLVACIHYQNSNPVVASTARRTIHEVLADGYE